MRPAEAVPRFLSALGCLGALACVLLLARTGSAESVPADVAAATEAERAFFEDGPGLLLPQGERQRLLALEPPARREHLRTLLTADLTAAIEKRRELAFDGFPATADARFILRFLHGAPTRIQPVDCGDTFVPGEVWTIGERRVLLFERANESGMRLWGPDDGKSILYTPLMQGWLEAWENRRGVFDAVRFDMQNCREAVLVDRVTGVPGLAEFGEYRVENRNAIDNFDLLAPPADLAAWATSALADKPPHTPSTPPTTTAPAAKLSPRSIEVRFPARDRGLLVAEIAIQLEPGALASEVDAETTIHRLSAHGFLERKGQVFERFRVRFRVLANPTEPTVLLIEQKVRFSEAFVARIWLTDDIGGGSVRIARGFVAPSQTEASTGVAGVPGVGAVGGMGTPGAPIPEVSDRPRAADSIAILPPIEEAVAVTWRATALVTGDRIRRVAFSVDGVRQLTVGKAPYSAEIRLSAIPTEQIIRAEGLDAAGKVVATDELILNPQGGRIGLRIVEPAGQVGAAVEVPVRLAVAIPGGRTVSKVELRVNEVLATTLSEPPWEAVIRLPPDELVFLVAEVVLDDGSGASATRTIRASGFIEDVEVQSVELYLTVTDRDGRFAQDLAQADVTVIEGKQKQEIQRFELVREMPLKLGVVLDTSGSMSGALAEAQDAGVAFLQAVMKKGDEAFLSSFSHEPVMLLPLTDDVGALVFALRGVHARGSTALHDAVVQGLRQLAGTRGQRALVLLSDGDDNASSITFENAVEYARRSGTVIYAIGLDLPITGIGVRNKLQELAASTGGRAFFASKASELSAIYGTIETELRSRYLVVYQRSGACVADNSVCPVEVKLARGLKARVTRSVEPRAPR